MVDSEQPFDIEVATAKVEEYASCAKKHLEGKGDLYDRYIADLWMPLTAAIREIERLAILVEQSGWQYTAEVSRLHAESRKELTTLRAENEKLRAAVSIETKINVQQLNELTTQRSQNEFIHKELRVVEDAYLKVSEECKSLRAKNENLQKKIKDIEMDRDVIEASRDDAVTALGAFQKYDGNYDLWAALVRERDELRATLAAAELDVRRVDWIESHGEPLYHIQLAITGEWDVVMMVGDEFSKKRYRRKTLREAIDAAIEQEGKP